MLIAGDHMNLKDYLYLNRLTVTEFGKKINYSRNHISGIINGRLRPNLRLAKAIENATNGEVKAEELLKGKEE